MSVWLLHNERSAYLFLPAIVIAAQPTADVLKSGITAFEARDGSKAVEILGPLAEKGSAKAQFYLGQVYWEGAALFPGVVMNKDLGWSWIKKAADQGFGEAEYFIGIDYMLGLNAPKDPDAGREWVKKAANHGYIPAMGVLGNAYYEGDGVKQDPNSAMNWFKKAARKGDAHSMFMIARMYTRGFGVTQDYIEAHAWMNLAASREKLIPGFDAEERESLARRMTAAQVAKAQVRAKSLAKELRIPQANQ